MDVRERGNEKMTEKERVQPMANVLGVILPSKHACRSVGRACTP